ncbi:hypothetical protein KRMM14A1004_44090 [Krasilnikovia sp. MM14-A1004]
MVGLSAIRASWGRLSAYSRTLLIAVCAIATVICASQIERLTETDPDPSSAWKAPAGYSVISSLDLGEGSVRLWAHEQDLAICAIQEEIDRGGHHRSAASGSCWVKSDSDWRFARGMQTFLFAVPKQQGDAILIIAPGGQRIGPIPVQHGLAMVKDYWPHESMELELQALDSSGKAVGPATDLQFEAV